jgi:uroporphyrinogen decarboxylase
MMHDDPDLAGAIFDRVGAILVEYYRLISEFDAVGACISNDDWGFKTQTLLSTDQMERWLFPRHREIVEAVHAQGKPVILHSCGAVFHLMDRISGYMGYDGKHSFEDTIMPIEEAWDRYHGEIALLGGIDVDFIIKSTPEEIYRRSRAMVERAQTEGSYALGTGNSVPEYVQPDHYFAMLEAAF